MEGICITLIYHKKAYYISLFECLLEYDDSALDLIYEEDFGCYISLWLQVGMEAKEINY